MTIHDPVVAATDVLLALLAFFYAFRLRREGSGDVARVGKRLFVWSGAAALFGAIFHGVFAQGVATPQGLRMWLVVGAAAGLTAIALYELGWMLAAAARPARAYRIVLYALCLVDLYVLGRIDSSYRTIVAFYAPALGLFTLAAGYRGLGSGEIPARLLFASGVVSTSAVLVQQAGVRMPAMHLDHNALYHLIQALGFALLYRGLSTWASRESTTASARSPP